MKTEPNLWDFGKVELDIPYSKRFKVLKLLKKDTYLSHDETAFLTALLWKTESVNYKILHIQSIIEKALRKCATSTAK